MSTSHLFPVSAAIRKRAKLRCLMRTGEQRCSATAASKSAAPYNSSNSCISYVSRPRFCPLSAARFSFRRRSYRRNNVAAMVYSAFVAPAPHHLVQSCRCQLWIFFQSLRHRCQVIIDFLNRFVLGITPLSVSALERWNRQALVAPRMTRAPSAKLKSPQQSAAEGYPTTYVQPEN